MTFSVLKNRVFRPMFPPSLCGVTFLSQSMCSTTAVFLRPLYPFSPRSLPLSPPRAIQSATVPFPCTFERFNTQHPSLSGSPSASSWNTDGRRSGILIGYVCLDPFSSPPPPPAPHTRSNTLPKLGLKDIEGSLQVRSLMNLSAGDVVYVFILSQLSSVETPGRGTPACEVGFSHCGQSPTVPRCLATV